MGDISEHFSRWEIECRCGCGRDTIDIESIMIIEVVRNHFKRPVHINSGSRCLRHNRNESSKDTSQHLLCRAIDFRVEDINPKIVYAFLTMKFPDKYGFGLYDFFVHADSRKTKKRWDKRKCLKK